MPEFMARGKAAAGVDAQSRGLGSTPTSFAVGTEQQHSGSQNL